MKTGQIICYNFGQFVCSLQFSTGSLENPSGWVYDVAMPTVMRIGGFRVVIYPNDHRPAHVHVVGSGKEAVFNLNCPDGPSELRQSFGLSLRDANDLAEQLSAELAVLCPEWRKIHGYY